MNMDIWAGGTSNQLQTKVVTGKTPFFVIAPFCTPQNIGFLTLAFYRTVSYGNTAFSVLVLSTKNSAPVF